MEVVALNERLRDDFSPLLKLLRRPGVAVAPQHAAASSASVSPHASDQYAQHCRIMLWRLNSYQYGSASAFLLDLQQLERVADSLGQKQGVESLLERLAVSEGAQESPSTVYTSGGATVALCVSGVRGVQEASATAPDTDRHATWLCNVSLRDQTVTLGTFTSSEAALEGYETQRKAMETKETLGIAVLRNLMVQVDADQREADKKTLREAVAQCHPRLTSSRASVLASSAVSAAAEARGLRVAPAKSPPLVTTVSPTSSAEPSELPVSPPRSVRKAAASSQKRPKPEAPDSRVQKLKKEEPASVETRNKKRRKQETPAAEGRSFLPLRRLIQQRLCRHLKSREVCVWANPETTEEDAQDKEKWRASGRLEAGKVFSFRRKKQLTFADFVRDELGHAASPCPHMFLVRSHESIDDHLKVCEAFTDEDREQLGRNLSGSVRNFMQTKGRKRA
ncbi:hypothetical protein BBJ28_00000970 [Nothophytophthora sp. Chile5]|nr:hypothetical protein BBJ28_00000970 [Nothophytophthora sp. Chile5]